MEDHMGLNKIIEAAAILAILAVGTGQLPRIIKAVRIAQIHLIKESQASNWPKALLLPLSK